MKAVLEDDAAKTITPTTSDFWTLVAALRQFIATEGGGHPPLEGSLPDMHAFTHRYLDMQRLYKEKSDADMAAVTAHLTTLLKTAGREALCPPAADIRRFCKHARHLHVVRCRPYDKGLSSDALRAALSAEDTSANASLLVLLQAVDRYAAQNQRCPGLYDSELEEDCAVLKGFAGAVEQEAGLSGVSVSEDLVGEMVRFGAGEVHVIGAVMGAMASQEAIKLLTGQFVPLGGTLIYNGMQCTTSVFG